MIGELYRRLAGLRMTQAENSSIVIERFDHKAARRLYSLRYISIVFAISLLPAFEHFSSVQRAKPKPQSRTFIIDSSASQIDVHLKQEGLISKRYPEHRIVVKAFNGKIELAKDETRMSVEVEAEAKTLTNVDETMSEFERKEFHHALRNLVLESEKFPTIKFVSVSISGIQKAGDNRSFTITGDLVMHGVTKRVSFPVNVKMKDEELIGSGEAKLLQSDFAMKPFEKGFGLIKVGDDVRITFNVVAKPQQ